MKDYLSSDGLLVSGVWIVLDSWGPLKEYVVGIFIKKI